MTKLSRSRYKELSRDPSLKLTPEDHEQAGGFLHFCDEWDGLLIDQTSDEFDCCSCTFNKEFDPVTGKLVKEGMMVKISRSFPWIGQRSPVAWNRKTVADTDRRDERADPNPLKEADDK